MSFLLGLADADIAIVASETRFVAGCKPGDPIASDGEAFWLKNPLGGPRVTIPAAPHRNVRPIGRFHPARGGWMTGTMQSPCLQLVYNAIQGHDATDVQAIADNVRGIVDRYRIAGTEDPAAPLAEGTIFLVSAGRWGLTSVTIRGDGSVSHHGGFSVPPDTKEDVFEREIVAPFNAAWRADCSPAARVRAVAQAFQDCAELCGPDGTVNDRVEIGMLRIIDTPGRWRLHYDYIPPTPAAELLEASCSVS